MQRLSIGLVALAVAPSAPAQCDVVSADFGFGTPSPAANVDFLGVSLRSSLQSGSFAAEPLLQSPTINRPVGDGLRVGSWVRPGSDDAGLAGFDPLNVNIGGGATVTELNFFYRVSVRSQGISLVNNRHVQPSR